MVKSVQGIRLLKYWHRVMNDCVERVGPGEGLTCTHPQALSRSLMSASFYNELLVSSNPSRLKALHCILQRVLKGQLNKATLQEIITSSFALPPNSTPKLPSAAILIRSI